MEKYRSNSENVSQAATQKTHEATWVAPLDSIKIFSIAEFTQFSSNPGTDGTATFSMS